MAFSNLWSSERLSFSLSIVAVISAAITSYYQFFDQSTDIATHRKATHLRTIPNLTPKGTFYDSIVATCTFMNSGSTPVSIIDSQLIIEVDSSKFDENTNDHPYLTFYNRIDDSLRYVIDVQSDYYLDSKSVSTFSFSANVDSTKLMQLLRDAPRAGLKRDSTAVAVNFHLWFLMVNPFGKYSMDVVSLSNAYYQNSGKYLFGTGSGVQNQTKKLPPFRDVEFWTTLSDNKFFQ